jgi:hypothetical protein
VGVPLLWLGIVGQLYTAIYPLVFFVMAAGVATVWALLVPSLGPQRWPSSSAAPPL